MNKIGASLAAFILSCTLFLGVVPQNALADVRDSDVVAGLTVDQRGLTSANCPNIAAQYAFAIDSDGNTYFERDPDTQAHIASVTRCMTALVALSYGDPQNTQITVSPDAATIGESSACCRQGIP